MMTMSALWLVAAILWTGSCAVKWPSLPWLRTITAYSVEMKWGQLRWDQMGIMRWGEVRWDEWWEISVTRMFIILHTAYPPILTSFVPSVIVLFQLVQVGLKTAHFQPNILLFISLNFNMNGCNNMVHWKRCNNSIFMLPMPKTTPSIATLKNMIMKL